MAFTPNPFDFSGTLDTSGYGLPTPIALQGNSGTTYGTGTAGSATTITPGNAYGGTVNTKSSNNSVTSVCAAVGPLQDQTALATAAANRVQQTQSAALRTY